MVLDQIALCPPNGYMVRPSALTEVSMGLKEWLIPQERTLFDLISQQSKNVLKGAEALTELVGDYQNLSEKRKNFKEIEKAGDERVKAVYQILNKSFITPIDHEDASRLTTLLDDTLDFMYGVVNRLYLYEIANATPPMVQLADTVVKCIREVDNMLSNLRRISQEELEKDCVEVDRLENLADELLNESVAKLFKSADPFETIKLKEIYEYLEIITDKCEDVADIIRDIVIKRS